MKDRFHLFVYGTLRAAEAAGDVLAECRRVTSATVPGALFDVDGRYPALLRGEEGVVLGEIWSCPAERLPELDRYEGTEEGLFRRVGMRVGDHACWAYVAGPAVARWLTHERRVASGNWLPGAATQEGHS